MKTRSYLTLIIVLVAAFGVAQADAGDRFFQIQVKQIAGGKSPIYEPPSPPGPNCYSFYEDGTWIDPLFPNPIGAWEAHPDGVVARYTAMAEWEGIPGVFPPLLLVQEGHITPTTGNGMVRLHGFSTLYVAGTPIVLAEFVSNGYEVDACP